MSFTINKPASRIARSLQPKRLGKTLAAVAGLASAVSVAVGVIAARSAPHGFSRLAVTLHLWKEPFIVKLAAGIAAVAVTAAALSGLVHFYIWWLERKVDDVGNR